MTKDGIIKELMPRLKETGVKNSYFFGDKAKIEFSESDFKISYGCKTVSIKYSDLSTIDFWHYKKGNAMMFWDKDCPKIAIWDH